MTIKQCCEEQEKEKIPRREIINSLLVACFLQINMFTLLFEQINGIIGILSILIVLIFVLNNGIKLRFDIFKIEIYIFILLACLSTFCLHGVNEYNLKYFIFFLMFGSIGFILNGINYNTILVYKFMVLTSIPVVIKIFSTKAYLVDFSRSDFYGYLMGITYALLPAYISSILLIVKCLILRNQKILKIIILFIFSGITFIYVKAASRGVILSILVFVIGLCFYNNKKLTFKYMIKLIILFFMLIIMLIYLKEFLILIQYLLVKVGIQFDALNKTIRLFEDSVGVSNGRFSIWMQALKDTRFSPFWGYGIGSYEQKYLSGYVHNLFIQMVYEFGYLVFFCACILGFYKIRRICVYEDKIFLWFLVSIGIVELLISSVFWISPRFWFIIGFIFKSKMKYDVSIDIDRKLKEG